MKIDVKTEDGTAVLYVHYADPITGESCMSEIPLGDDLQTTMLNLRYAANIVESQLWKSKSFT